jgi:hypothetical protein
MTSKNMQRTKQIVKVAGIRKQRLANAAADARRDLALAEMRLTDAAEIVETAQNELDAAGVSFTQNPASEQLLIWRNQCAVNKAEKIEAHVQMESEHEDAAHIMSERTRALQRQNLRHDHLSDVARKERGAMRRMQEARLDDEQQGSGQQNSMFFGSKEI